MLAIQLEAKAGYDQAVADRAVAQLNLDRSEVHASVKGTISNMDLRPGTYVTAGKGVIALVDTDAPHVDRYFEETKLPRIHVGDRVAIHLMGNAAPLRGAYVESIASGIEDRDRGEGTNLLANLNPTTFSWVRLAQRSAYQYASRSTVSWPTGLLWRAAQQPWRSCRSSQSVWRGFLVSPVRPCS